MEDIVRVKIRLKIKVFWGYFGGIKDIFNVIKKECEISVNLKKLFRLN